MLKAKTTVSYRRGSAGAKCRFCLNLVPHHKILGIGGELLGEGVRCRIIGLQPGRQYRIGLDNVCDQFNRAPFLTEAAAPSLPPVNTVVGLPEIREICLYYGLERLWEKIEADPPCTPFSSDGASCFPDTVCGIDIYLAAFLHDLKYWAGYPGEETERFLADMELAIDVVRLCGGSPELAMIILEGVRVGGSENLPTPWRWGFGR